MPWMARFIVASRQVRSFDSWPYTAMSSRRPRCARTNFSAWTNMPPDPQHGSYTRPEYGSSTSTSSRTTLAGV